LNDIALFNVLALCMQPILWHITRKFGSLQYNAEQFILWCHFESWANLFFLHYTNSLSCMNE